MRRTFRVSITVDVDCFDKETARSQVEEAIEMHVPYSTRIQDVDVEQVD